jgi:hypothetical protein
LARRKNQLDKPIQIRQLLEKEIAKLIASSKFNKLYPFECGKCGSKDNFARQVFLIGGLPKSEYTSDNTQSLIAYHLKEKYAIENVFFKTHLRKFYVDSAKCNYCQSTRIKFDLIISDDLLAEVSRLTGKSIEQIRNEMKVIADKMAILP